ncbi:MAG: phosphoglycerate dehydrogenase [Alphaproteobacteria bacterium]|nr:phosphoglycerate dehydrogenase [Alphaproteobacteria bacterium]MDP6563795.1 phosphoglycerate dehydrogenase [Alphaproteobacteria bacterium]MDP6811768.1 phosphoglycerate dehydrogenase [Alphaproteobacteria bacterium]
MPDAHPDAMHCPKDEVRVLLLEGIAETASTVFAEAGHYSVEQQSGALAENELIDALPETDILGIRSRTQITDRVIQNCGSLTAIGCFSVGTNQVALEAARQTGIPVFNAPFSNTRSVAELTIAEIVMLSRRIFPRAIAAHAGAWHKSAIGSNEVRGKVLGIVGYGNIGSQLAMLAESLSMRVVYFDPADKLRHGNVAPMAGLDELLAISNVVSLHVPQTPETRNMIGAREIALMKPGAFLINNARGNVVDLDALAAALRDSNLGGAAIDVFPVEPSSGGERFLSPLQGLDNVILTPHIGGSTCEAQDRIGEEVSRKLVEYSDVGSTVGAVNFPQVQLSSGAAGTRFIQVQRNLPGELGRLNAIFAEHEVNIASQHYQTDNDIGYAVMEADARVNDAGALLRQIQKLPSTIRTRMVQ